MDFARSNNIDDVGIPEDLRCKRSDGKQWRCSALSMPDKTVCEKHYIQAKKRAANSALRASMKKAKRKPVDEGDSYLDSKDEVDLSLMNTKGGESPVQMKKYKEKIPKTQPYSPETVTMRGLSRNHQKSTVDSQRDVPHIDENRPKSAYRTPPSVGSFRYKTQNSNGTTHGDLSSKSSDYSGEIGGLTCHQCQRDDRETVIWCLRCDRKGYCDVCISKWYPDIQLDEIRRACPACCGACNCKACFHPDSLIKARIREIAARDKLQYLHSLLSLVLPVLKKIHSEQSFELELETRTQGTKTDIPRAKLHPDEQMCCDCCKVPIIDYHRHCSSCMYDLCLTCCRDLRQTTQEDKRSHDGHSPTSKTKSTTLMEQNVMIDPSHLFPDWKANSDGSIPCPPKESGGCGCQSLPLRRIFKMNWVAKLVKNAEEMVNGCKVNGVGGVRTCLSCSWSISSESSELVDSKLVKASHREDSSDNYLYSPAPQDIKIDGICHFRKHWHKGEPIAVKGMADFMLTSSWDPMVLWRGIQEISEENATENNYILKAVDCLDWSDVDIEVGQYVEGYFEGRVRDDGWQEMLKLKDWPRPSALEEFLYYQRPEFLSKLPLLEYIHSKWGLLNLAAKLPHDSLQADVGPKLFIAYGMQEELGRGDSVTNLHVNMGDVVFVLMNTSEVSFHGQKQPKSLMIHETVRESDEKESLGDVDMVEPEISLNNGGKSPDLAPKGIDYGGGLSAKDYGVVEETMRNEAVTTSGEMNSVKLSHSVKDIEGVDSEKDHAGALWDVFRRQDVSKLNEYLKIHWNEFQSHARLSGNSSGVHPLHDQDVFLNRDHLRKLKEEFNIEPWTFEQRVHEAVFIPAGCPLQMRNLQSSVQLCLDFLSPDSLGESVSLAQDIRCLPNDHGAKLQMLEVGKMSLYAASSAIKEIQKLILDPIVGPELAFEDRNLTALVSENIEKMVKRRQITCI